MKTADAHRLKWKFMGSLSMAKEHLLSYHNEEHDCYMQISTLVHKDGYTMGREKRIYWFDDTPRGKEYKTFLGFKRALLRRAKVLHTITPAKKRRK